jgi:hypothetical protein
MRYRSIGSASHRATVCEDIRGADFCPGAGRLRGSRRPTAAAREGSGNQTLGLVSQSGKFRLRWQTHLEPGREAGATYFKLTVHSGVSGRALQEAANQRGPGEGAYNVEDDPRPFNLMVEAEGLTWRIVADEIVLTRSQEP